MVPLKYLSSFWRILEMHLINCEVTLDLNWSENSVIVSTNHNILNNGYKTLYSSCKFINAR